MKKAYIYPNSFKKKNVSNPYLKDFTQSLSPYITFINTARPSRSGILDLTKYLHKIDFLFLNWIEDLPDKKGGIFQSIIFLFYIPLIKLKRIKVFYTLHNKESHYKTHNILKKIIRTVIFKSADFIICHSSEGLKLGPKIKTKNFKYIPHPFNQPLVQLNSKYKLYDILIWGAIKPYKGIDNYLKYLESKNLLNKYKTLIIGKIYPPEYEKELLKYNLENIQIENKYVNDLELNECIAKSKLVLFTYNENSILSSGALVYSLSQGASVIGPKTGAFQDLFNEGIIEVFDNYDELIQKIDSKLTNSSSNSTKLSHFVAKNNWEAFGKEIGSWISIKS